MVMVPPSGIASRRVRRQIDDDCLKLHPVRNEVGHIGGQIEFQYDAVVQCMAQQFPQIVENHRGVDGLCLDVGSAGKEQQALGHGAAAVSRRYRDRGQSLNVIIFGIARLNESAGPGDGLQHVVDVMRMPPAGCDIIPFLQSLVRRYLHIAL
jgi:hypothetical protein